MVLVLSLTVVVDERRTVPVFWLPEELDDLLTFTSVFVLRVVLTFWFDERLLLLLPFTLPDDLRPVLTAEPLFCLADDTSVEDLLPLFVDIVAALSGCTLA